MIRGYRSPDARIDYGELSRQSDLSIAARAVHGIWTAALCFLIVVLSSTYFTDHPAVVLTAAASLITIMSLRLFAGRPKGPRDRLNRRKLYFSTIILSGSFWGIFYAVTIYLYGVSHWTSLVLVICGAGICSAATTSFAPNIGILRGFLLAQIIPGLAVCLWIGGRSAHATALALALYLSFALIQGRNRSREYWDTLVSNALLKIEELERKRAQEELLRARDELELRVEERTFELVGANETLRAREEQFRALIEQAADCVLITSHDAILLDVNSSGCVMTGYAREELLGRPVFDLLTAEDQVLMQPVLEDVQAGKTVFEETHIRRKYGSLVEVEFSAKMLSDRRLLAFVRDVSERRKMAEQLRLAQEMEAIGQLAAGVSHDFNNVLGIISGYALTLLEDLPADSPSREDASEIVAAAVRGAALTNQLLTVSQGQSIRPQILNLNNVICGLENMLGAAMSEQIELRFELSPDLGLVRADPSQIEQVIMNLAINARDAMASGGRLTIATSNADQPGAHVLLTVTDTGQGMDERTKSRVFEPFFTTKEVGRGTGLGLAIVYGIVKRGAGDISVESTLGRGTTFSICLPRLNVMIQRSSHLAT